MIHYHGTPIGGKRVDVCAFLTRRHALIPFPRHEDISIASEVCRSFCVDNGAFSAWRSGEPVSDWSGYYEWVAQWMRHPRFDWAIIPDVIDGDEAANDELLAEWPHDQIGVPVWHLHESLDRLERLVSEYHRVALGSSGEWSDPGSKAWCNRMAEAMSVACDDNGMPRAKLHGLRMLDPKVFTQLPLTSADSTNAAVNGSRKAKLCGCSDLIGRVITAENVEVHQSASVWSGACVEDRQGVLF